MSNPRNNLYTIRSFQMVSSVFQIAQNQRASTTAPFLFSYLHLLLLLIKNLEHNRRWPLLRIPRILGPHTKHAPSSFLAPNLRTLHLLQRNLNRSLMLLPGVNDRLAVLVLPLAPYAQDATHALPFRNLNLLLLHHNRLPLLIDRDDDRVVFLPGVHDRIPVAIFALFPDTQDRASTIPPVVGEFRGGRRRERGRRHRIPPVLALVPGVDVVLPVAVLARLPQAQDAPPALVAVLRAHAQPPLVRPRKGNADAGAQQLLAVLVDHDGQIELLVVVVGQDDGVAAGVDALREDAQGGGGAAAGARALVLLDRHVRVHL